MKKLLIATVLFGMATTMANAQIISLGMNAGANSTNIKADEIFNLDNGDIAELYNGQNKLGYHVGLTSRIKIAGLFVQPELFYTSINSVMMVKDPNGIETEEEINIQRLDMPILAGLKLGPAVGFVGPVLSRQIQTHPETEEWVFKKGTWGFQVGAGVEFGKFGIDLRYEGSISSPVNEVTIGSETFEFDSRVSQVILSGVYRFW